MVRLDCSGVRFYSQNDEKHLFGWALDIAGVLRWEQDTLVVRNALSQASILDLVALFRRYKISMTQLAQFRTAKNEQWFADPRMHWYKPVFGAA
ncbi:MAG: hypothetical protein ACJ8GW_17265 [Massilia sp.]